MKSICAWALLAGFSGLASARPVVIEEAATLTNPDPTTYVQFGRTVATNGEYAVALGARDILEDGNLMMYRAALLYRRVGSQWQFQRVLQSSARAYDSYRFPSQFAMKGNLAVIELDGNTQAYRLDATGWQPAGAMGGNTEDIEIAGDTVVTSTGACSWSAKVAEPNGSGGWTSTYLSGQPRDCDDEHWGGPVDIDGDRVIIGNENTEDSEDQEVLIFQRSGPDAWNRMASIVSPFGYRGFSGEVALRGDDYIVDAALGAYVHRSPLYQPATTRLQPPDAYLQSRIDYLREDSKIEKSGGFVFVQEPSYDRNGQVINVYRANASVPGTYEHVAMFAPSAGATIIKSFDVSGNVVIASGAGTAYVFELPASFTNRTPKQENFETGSAANWTATAGSQFSIVASGSNHVYRQNNSASDARAILGSTNWTNQAVEAQVTPTAFEGTDRWVGLITRYQDPQNYFYVTLRSSGSMQLKRLRAGVITTIASAAYPVAVNQRYRMRLESIGSVHRVYVNGALLLDADDAGSPHYGNAGLMTNRARADFDNVVVTPSPLTTVFVDDFSSVNDPGAWTLSGSGQWAENTGNFSQGSVAADARAVIGSPTADQVVEARVRQIAWSTTGTAERWAGVLARYKDNNNYYYLHLRSGGTVSLRKLVNGAIATLAEAPLSVSLNTQYALRLEVVGNQLRGFVNGNLLLQATDNSHAAGVGGLMTNKTAAQFDDYLAYQP